MSTSSLDRLPLRERKKLKTRRAIQEHALRLFAANGYDATTVEQIAEAAEISPSTFFRYFPTKEDVVVTDEWDPVMERIYRDQSADLDPIEGLRLMMAEAVGEMVGADKARLLARTKLIESVPALRARAWDLQQQTTHSVLVQMLSERLGRTQGDLDVRMFVGALIGMMQALVSDWTMKNGESDLMPEFAKIFDRLENGFDLGPKS